MPPRRKTLRAQAKKSSRKTASPPLSAPVAPATVKRRPTRAELRRRDLLHELWPDAKPYTWHRSEETGFTTVPRTLALIGALIKSLTDKTDASRVYFDLWCRAFDEGFVEVMDEAEFALSCGYPKGTRHVRTWQERIRQLQKLGFVAVRPKPSRAIGFILLLHPHDVVMHLQSSDPGRVPAWWQELFRTRISEIGAHLRDRRELPTFLATASGKVTTA